MLFASFPDFVEHNQNADQYDEDSPHPFDQYHVLFGHIKPFDERRRYHATVRKAVTDPKG